MEGSNMEGREVTLSEMLDFREKKAMLQTELMNNGMGCVVVSLGMNIPGPVKSTPAVFHVFEEGQHLIENMLRVSGSRIVEKCMLKENAGYAAIYQVLGAGARDLKKKMATIEETHACGRLFDIDVLGVDGNAVTREQVGVQRRKCLLCEQDAKICGRSRAHSVKELSDQVGKIIQAWEKETW